MTIAFALIADMTALPALLMTVDTKNRSQLAAVEDASNA